MKPEQFQRVKQLYEEAFTLAEEERAAFLDRECADDPEVRAEVEALLARQTEAESTTLLTDLGESPGHEIGPYRLTRRLGEGGMGVVWQAEQRQPVRRTVALKLIKPGMDTREVVARFETERQALALMSHPGIAQVFDAGATKGGRPYFVMEYVPGLPITEFCDGESLSIVERLELFRSVCDAVQHAHQKGVIHRDLKPSNVLVALRNGKPFAKVIDFGVAKATQKPLTEATLFTELGQLVGTPAYMSPEQATASALDVDTRTDVYSLGVLLYELLVGVLPFDKASLREAGYVEIRRVIREVDPPTPSKRLTSLDGESGTIARRRRTDVGHLRRQLRGDLDWVVMKALEKDRARRYDSASGLAADIGRHLADEPVVARPPSKTYRLRKFARRNRVLVGGIAATFLALSAGVTVSTILAIRESRARAAEQATRADLEQVVEFQSEMLERIDITSAGVALWDDLQSRVADERRAQGLGEAEIEQALAALGSALEGVSAVDVARSLIESSILDPAAETLRDELSGRPGIEARLERTLSGSYRAAGIYDAAVPHARRAVELSRTQLGEHHPETWRAMNELGHALHRVGEDDEALELHESVIALTERVPDSPERARAIRGVPIALDQLRPRRFDELGPLWQRAIDVCERVFGPEARETLGSRSNLAQALKGDRQWEKALAIYEQLAPLMEQRLGLDDEWTLVTLANHGDTLRLMGRTKEAEAVLRRAVELREERFGEDDPRVVYSKLKLAELIRRRDRRGAELLMLEALETSRRFLGTDHARTQWALTLLGHLALGEKRWDDAERYLLDALDAARSRFGDEHSRSINALNSLSNLYRRTGRLEQAQGMLEQAVAAAQKSLGTGDVRTQLYLKSLGEILARRGLAAEAQRRFEEYLEICETERCVTSRTVDAVDGLRDIVEKTGPPERHRELSVRLLEARRQYAEESRSAAPKVMYAFLALNIEPEDLRDVEAAVEFARQAVEMTDWAEHVPLRLYAQALDESGQNRRALEALRRGLETIEDQKGRSKVERLLATLQQKAGGD